MKIGELAAATDSPVETIRYYEREGLLAAPARTAANYRHYGAAHVQRLAFIRRCRSLDMGLDEVRALLRYQDLPTDNCAEVNAVLDEHIGHVAQRVRELRLLERQLRDLRARCASALSGQACGILEQLNAEPGTPAPARRKPAVHSAVAHVHGRPGRANKA